jgi:hypothetical protein
MGAILGDSHKGEIVVREVGEGPAESLVSRCWLTAQAEIKPEPLQHYPGLRVRCRRGRVEESNILYWFAKEIKHRCLLQYITVLQK